MRTGTVIVTDLGGTGNKIFHTGDIVTERNFPTGNFEKLVAGGYIKEALEPAPLKVEVKNPVEAEAIEAEVKKDTELKEQDVKVNSEKENKPETPDKNKGRRK